MKCQFLFCLYFFHAISSLLVAQDQPSFGKNSLLYTSSTVPQYEVASIKEVNQTTDFWGTWLGLEYLIRLQTELMDIEKVEGYQRYTNIELSTQVGRLSSGYGLWNTRVQLNWGVLSGQLRFNQHFGQPTTFDQRFPQNTFASLDIQFFQFNVLPFRKWNVRMGFGNMHEFATNNNHGEVTVAADVFLNRIRLNAEYRMAYNNDTDFFARQEWNMAVHYRLGQTYKRQNVNLYVMGKLLNYPQNAAIWMLTGGVNVRLE